MRISDCERVNHNGRIEVSAIIDDFRLWFRVPKDYQVASSGDAYVAAALLPAMSRGENIEVEPRLCVSPAFLKGVDLLQQIFHAWNPALRQISVKADTSPGSAINPGAATFFSGGVDSTYTFLKHLREISHLLCIHGFDFFFNEGGGHIFKTEDVKDLGSLVFKLLFSCDPVSAFLRSKLNDTTLETLASYRDLCSSPTKAEIALVTELNRILRDQPLFNRELFSAVSLRSETREALSKNFDSRDQVVRLNRLLLEDAYPRELTGKAAGAYDQALERNTKFAASFGKVLIPIETNFYPFGYRYNLSRNLSQGGCLGSIALLLGFPATYVPSSYSYAQLFPLGSHPMSDPLWSNEGVEIVHDGCEAGRADKLRLISTNSTALMNLRVCFDNANVNCGKCAKCLRTMISLKLLRAPDGPFPPFPSRAEIRSSQVSGDVEMAFFDENVALARESGCEQLANDLLACKLRHERKSIIKAIDRVFFGSLGLKAYRKAAPVGQVFQRIDTTPSRDY